MGVGFAVEFPAALPVSLAVDEALCWEPLAFPVSFDSSDVVLGRSVCED